MAPSKVNTETMPGDNMSPSAIEAAASSINTVGTKVSAEGGTVLTSWQKISAYYHAPEQGTLFHAMNPVKTEAEKFGTDVGTVSTALGTFAEEVRTIKAAVVSIRADAKTFLDSIANGVEQDTPQIKGETTKITVDWHEDAGAVAANNALVDRIDRQQEALWRAERTCANAIYDTIGHVHIEAASETNAGGYGVDHIPDNAGMPWGDKVEKTENCSEGISKGLEHGAGAMASGIGALFGVSYSSKDGWDFFSGSTAGNAWKGVGMFAVGVATFGPGGLALGAIPGPVGTFFRDSQKLVPTAVAGLVAIDLNAKDPLHKWKEKGWEALGESIFNVGTLFVAPTKAGNLGRLGRVGEVAAKAGDTVYLALQASKALKSLAGLTVEGLSKLRAATHFGDALDFHAPEIPSIARERVSTDVPNTGHNPADATPARDHTSRDSGADPAVNDRTSRDSGADPAVNDHTSRDSGADPAVNGHTSRDSGADPAVNGHTSRDSGADPAVNDHTSRDSGADPAVNDPAPANGHPQGDPATDPNGSHTPGTDGTGDGTSNTSPPATAPAPHLPPGLEVKPWEAPLGHEPVPTGHLERVDADHPPVQFTTHNANELGRIGEDLTAQELKRQGWDVVFHGRHVDMPGQSGRYFVPDFIAVDASGHVIAVESKMGSGAHFTPGQLQGYERLAQGQPLEARSAAMQEVLDRLGITHVDEVQVFRWNTVHIPDATLINAAGLAGKVVP